MNKKQPIYGGCSLKWLRKGKGSFSYEICCWGKSKSAKEAKEATEEGDCYSDYHCKPCSAEKLDDYLQIRQSEFI
jgi:hypothetical protein